MHLLLISDFKSLTDSKYDIHTTPAVTQQMDNVVLSCLLAMANVAVTDCRDGLCRSGLWARWISTAIRIPQLLTV